MLTALKAIAVVILIALMLATAVRAEYETVTLEWDYNNPSSVEGFRLFFRSVGKTRWVKLWEGTQLSATVDMPPGTWQFTCRAFKGKEESKDSNVVTHVAKKKIKP